MSRLIPIVLLVVVGGVAFLWLRAEPASAPKSSGPEPESRSGKGETGTNPDLVGDRTDPNPARSANHDHAEKVDPPKTPADQPKVAADLAGIGLTPEHAAFVDQWHATVKTEQQQCLDVFADGGEPQQAGKDFNKIMDGHRQRLIRALGKDQANAVLRKRAIYKFDLRSGAWFRQDADGQPAAFQDPGKEDIWVNFKKRDG